MILIILFFLAVLKWHNYPRVYDIVETGVYANKDHSKPTKQCDHKVVTPQNSKQNKKNLIIVITNKKAFKWIKPIFAEGKQLTAWTLSRWILCLWDIWDKEILDVCFFKVLTYHWDWFVTCQALCQMQWPKCGRGLDLINLL